MILYPQRQAASVHALVWEDKDTFVLFVRARQQGDLPAEKNNTDKCAFSNVTAEYNFQIDGEIIKALF